MPRFDPGDCCGEIEPPQDFFSFGEPGIGYYDASSYFGHLRKFAGVGGHHVWTCNLNAQGQGAILNEASGGSIPWTSYSFTCDPLGYTYMGWGRLRGRYSFINDALGYGRLLGIFQWDGDPATSGLNENYRAACVNPDGDLVWYRDDLPCSPRCVVLTGTGNVTFAGDQGIYSGAYAVTYNAMTGNEVNRVTQNLKTWAPYGANDWRWWFWQCAYRAAHSRGASGSPRTYLLGRFPEQARPIADNSRWGVARIDDDGGSLGIWDSQDWFDTPWPDPGDDHPYPTFFVGGGDGRVLLKIPQAGLYDLHAQQEAPATPLSFGTAPQILWQEDWPGFVYGDAEWIADYEGKWVGWTDHDPFPFTPRYADGNLLTGERSVISWDDSGIPRYWKGASWTPGGRITFATDPFVGSQRRLVQVNRRNELRWEADAGGRVWRTVSMPGEPSTFGPNL